MLTILQGDALSVPISIKLNGKEVTTADIQAVKVTMGGIEKRYPGEITYDSGRFLFPLTQEETFSVRTGLVHVQIRVKYAGGGEPKVIGVDLGDLRIAGSMSREVL